MVFLSAKDKQISFRPRTLVDFPDAQAFLTGLLDKGSVSVTTAQQYVKLVARLRRQRRLAAPDLIALTPERTAANAYHAWAATSYGFRAQLVTDALGAQGEKLRPAIPWLRRGSLVPPSPEKRIPMPVNPITEMRDYVPCDKWTLHVPKSDVRPHTDPCADCETVELTDAQVVVIAEAFAQAWGSRDVFWTTPADARLLGEPPLGGYGEKPRQVEVVALSGRTTVSDALARAEVLVTRSVNAFVDLLREGVDGIYLERAMCADKLDDVLEAIEDAWINNKRIVPLTEHRLRDAWSSPAPNGNWDRDVNLAGDLLYVGSAMDLRRRLVTNLQNHPMWAIYDEQAKRSPLIRIAVWQYPGEEVRGKEGALTRDCGPLWSRCSRRGADWGWREPDLLLRPVELDTKLLDKISGVYAWLVLPEGASLYSVMIEQAPLREPRRIGKSGRRRRREWLLAQPPCCQEAHEQTFAAVHHRRKDMPRLFTCPTHGTIVMPR